MLIHKPSRNIALSFIYFFLSTVITWWFIYCGTALYHFDEQKMLLSCCIAGGKWALQIVAALVFLGDKKWLFIRRIAFTCFIGSCILLPYCFAPIRNMIPGNPFLVSLIAAVAAMLILYYRSVGSTAISIKWYFGWVCCLAVAISLQLTVVFHVL